jgi:hypothetical protein
MQIFWRLILAHLLTDFTFQTDRIADWKRRSAVGGLVHSGIFLVCAAVLTFGHLGEAWLTIGGTVVIRGWLALLLLTFFHFCEDEWRIWTIREKNSPDSFAFFLWDQLIHVMFIFVFAHADEGGVTEPWVLLAILLILVTHFTSIFIYFLEKDVFGRARLVPREKYVSMAARLVTASIPLLPLAFYPVILVAWVAVLSAVTLKRGHASWIDVVAGNILAVIFGLIARHVLYI